MHILSFLLFLAVSHLAVMQIFRLTTYHAYFLKALPLLLAYSALVGFLLHELEMHAFFLYQVILASIWLFVVGRKQLKQIESMLMVTGDDADTVRSMAWSFGRTKQYYAYSAFIYVITFSLTYLWLLNTAPRVR
jgi:hypothetical protein